MENSIENNSIEKKRILPVVNIAGTPFHADAALGEYREVANPGNKISVHEMMSFTDHNEFLFDKQTKRIFDNNRFDVSLPESVESVWLRPIAATDPQGMEILISEGTYKWAELYSTPLPKIDIGGTAFYIDPIRNGFRQVDNRWNMILFSDTNFTEPRTVYFDQNAKNVPFPHELNIYDPPASLPSHIVLGELPSAEKMAQLLKDIRTVNVKTINKEEKKPHEKQVRTRRKGRKL